MLMAVYRLASHLGKTVSELSSMPMSEFVGWMAYLRSDPVQEAENARAAALMAQITNMSGRSLPKGRHVKPEEFLPKRRKPQTWQEQKRIFQAITGSGNG